MSSFYKILASGACIAAAFALNAGAEGDAGFSTGGFTYEILNADEVAVTGFSDPQFSPVEINVPPVVEFGDASYVVTAINGPILRSSAISLVLPPSISECSPDAFTGADEISRVYISSAEQWLSIDLGDNPNPFTVATTLYVNNERTTSLTLPEGIETISAGRFKGMKCVDTVKLPDGCVAVEESAFENSSVKYFEPGLSLQQIGKNAFKGAPLIHFTIPSTTLLISESAFENCSKLRTVKNGSMLAAIPESAFRGCTSLYSVELGGNIAEIRDGAFSGCLSLTTVTVPDKVTDIGAEAFAGCAGLKRIVLGTSVCTIAPTAFSGVNPAEVILKSTEPVAVDAPVVSGATVYVPEELLEAYEADPNWADDNEIAAMAPLKLNLTAAGEPVEGVVSLASGNQLRLSAKMSGQEFEGTWADSQTVMTWVSSDEDVAVVDATGNLTAKATGTATITVSTQFDYGTYTQSCEVAVDYAAPTSVKISAQNTLMALGTNLALKAAVLPAGALQQVVWSAETPAVAVVSADGVITPVAPGTATFRAAASADENVSSTIQIEVVYAKPTEVTVTIDKEVLRVGDTAQLTATVNSQHASQDVMWFTGNDKIATVSNTGALTCVGVGDVTISALTTNDKHIIGTISLFVDYSEPTQITVSNPALSLKIGDTEKIEFTVEPAGAEQRADWTSDNEEVATVDEYGNVTAVGVGSATITGTTGSLVTECSVEVDYADPVRVFLNYTGIYLTVDESSPLTAVVLPAGARQDIVWKSSNEEVATVDQEGLVTGIAAGNASIIAMADADNEVWGGCNVIVMEAVIDAIEGIGSDDVKATAAGGSISLTGLESGTVVNVYDLNGQLTCSATADGSGRAETKELRRGVYIIKYGTRSRKIAL